MPSTFSPSLRLELIGSGEQAANWNNTTNTNLGTLLEQAITGVATVTFPTDADRTLTASNGVSDESRNAVLVLTSGVSLTATRSLIVPTANKFYAVRNTTSGSKSILVKTSAGTGVTLVNGCTQLMYCDGTNVVPASVPISAADGSALVSGNFAVAGASSVSGNSEVGGNLTVFSASSVTGNSSVGGNLTVSGASSVTGNSSVGGNLTVTGTVTAAGGLIMPTGALLEYGGSSAPTGWLLCNGAAVSRTTYAALFAVLGTAYGAGDGSTTFNVPNKVDRVGVGAGSSYARGATGGAASTTTSNAGNHAHGGAVTGTAISTAQMPSHNHNGTTDGVGDHSHGLPYPALAYSAGGEPGYERGGFFEPIGTIGNTNGAGAHAHNFTTNATGSNQSHDHGIYTDGLHNHSVSTIPPYLASNYIIKT